jgi:hypothetical protein
MAQINLSKAAQVVHKNLPDDPVKVKRIVEEMNRLVADKEDAPPSVPKQFVILISDPEGLLPKRQDFVGWVLQIPENESPATTQDRILRAAYDFNCSKKGRLLPVKTVGEAIENVTAKFFKEADVWVKTKTPVLMLKTDNEIPKDTTATVTVKSKTIGFKVDRKGVTALAKDIETP